MKRLVIVAMVVLVVVGFLAYGASMTGKFIWDDAYLVASNAYIKNISHLPALFSKNIGAGSGKMYHFYRPLQMLTYMLDYHVWKLRPVGYHLTNILLHVAAALLLCWFLYMVTADFFISWLAALFFCIHPVQTEAVAYISGRSDSLALVFMLLTFILYLTSYNSSKPITRVVSLVCFSAALLSRESSLILPALIGCYHIAFQKKIKRGIFLPLVAMAAAYVLIRLTLLRAILPHLESTTTLLQRLPGACVAFTNYIQLLVFPLQLHMEYGNFLFPAASIRVFLAVFVLVSVLCIFFVARKKNTLLFFALSWFFVALAPQLNLYPINAYMAEHWLYLPSIGFCLILAWALVSWYRSGILRKLCIGIAAFFIIASIGLDIKQAWYWNNPIIFCQRTLMFSPKSVRIRNELGLEYLKHGQKKKAQEAFEKVLALEPNNAGALNNLGVLYSEEGKTEEAVAFHKQAIAINPQFAEAYDNLGILYRENGNLEEALAMHKKALSLDPMSFEAYNNLAAVLGQQGKFDEAMAALQKAVSLNPNYALGYANLAVIAFNVKDYSAAKKYYLKAKQLGYADPAIEKALGL